MAALSEIVGLALIFDVHSRLIAFYPKLTIFPNKNQDDDDVGTNVSIAYAPPILLDTQKEN